MHAEVCSDFGAAESLEGTILLIDTAERVSSSHKLQDGFGASGEMQPLGKLYQAETDAHLQGIYNTAK